jgi:alpha-tubulin suppressor-like RCC1 family protein
MVLKTGQIYCWGANDAGQLGDPTTDGRYSPHKVAGITDAASVASGHDFTCARLKAGTVQCWGNLPGFASPVTSPTTIAGLANATELSAGFMACGLMASGTVRCWEPSASAPTQVAGITDAKAISVGGGHACALVRGGVVKCWGDNWWGQLGDETTTDSDTPVTAKGP